MTFDLEGTFGDDYLYFYEDSIDDEHSDSDTAEILGLLDLPAGSRILDAPCGHGRIACRLAAAGMLVDKVVASSRASARIRSRFFTVRLLCQVDFTVQCA